MKKQSGISFRVPKIPQIVYSGNPHIVIAKSISEGNRLVGLRVKFTIEGFIKIPLLISFNLVETVENSTEELHLVELERDIFFNDTQQAVMTKLGAPSKIYYKSEEKMLLIQRKGTSPERLNQHDDDNMPDFFFNYFTLGLVSGFSITFYAKICKFGRNVQSSGIKS